jgi:uncharacterized protein YidB (DUF937 family)
VIRRAGIRVFDTIGALLRKSDNSPTSVPEALVADVASHEGGLNGLVQKFESAGLGGVISSGSAAAKIRRSHRTRFMEY